MTSKSLEGVVERLTRDLQAMAEPDSGLFGLVPGRRFRHLASDLSALLSELQSRDATIARLEGEREAFKERGDHYARVVNEQSAQLRAAEAALAEAVKVVERLTSAAQKDIEAARTFLSKQEGGK